jgi:hypothetical protein
VQKFIAMTACFVVLSLAAVTLRGAEDEDLQRPNDSMTDDRLEQILKTLEPSIKGKKGRWQFARDGIPLMVLTDESGNRMRIVAPITGTVDATLYTLLRMMEANFVTALDARYALFQGMIWVTYVHPLDSLRERDFLAGLQQVITLVKTTGTTYSSSELEFRPSSEKQ